MYGVLEVRQGGLTDCSISVPRTVPTTSHLTSREHVAGTRPSATPVSSHTITKDSHSQRRQSVQLSLPTTTQTKGPQEQFVLNQEEDKHRTRDTRGLKEDEGFTGRQDNGAYVLETAVSREGGKSGTRYGTRYSGSTGEKQCT